MVSKEKGKWEKGDVVYRKTWHRFLFPTVLMVLLVGVAIFIGGSWTNATRVADSYYITPRTASDWAGWATAMGALGTTGALIYAALKFRADMEEQRNLRMDRDAEARKAATPLKVTIRQIFDTENSPSPSGLYLKLTNTGNEKFSDIQIKIPDVDVEVNDVKTTSIPPELVEGDPSLGTHPPKWRTMAPPIRRCSKERLWLCGDLKPRSIMRVKIDFNQAQSASIWELEPTDPSDLTRARQGRIAVIFTDHAGHNWVRMTEGRQALQRLWPDAHIVEDKSHRIRASEGGGPTPSLESGPSGDPSSPQDQSPQPHR